MNNILEKITKRKKEIANQVEAYANLPYSSETKEKREKLMQEYFELSSKEVEEERKKGRQEMFGEEDAKPLRKINGKTIEEVLGKDWKEKINNLSGEDITKERNRLKRLIRREKSKEILKENGK